MIFRLTHGVVDISCTVALLHNTLSSWLVWKSAFTETCNVTSTPESPTLCIDLHRSLILIRSSISVEWHCIAASPVTIEGWTKGPGPCR